MSKAVVLLMNEMKSLHNVNLMMNNPETSWASQEKIIGTQALLRF